MLCPKCRKNEMTVYNGSLGYESLVCYYCNLDVKSEEMITCCNIYEGEMRSKLREAKDKLHRRNMQIKELKNKVNTPLKSNIRIEKITVEREIDGNPDLSYLEQDYSDVKNEKEKQKYLEQDKKRLAEYNNDSWSMLGITAKAEVSYDIGQGSRRIERFTSGGLWGIESDSDEKYLIEVENEQLENLKEHLRQFNVNVTDFESKVNR